MQETFLQSSSTLEQKFLGVQSRVYIAATPRPHVVAPQRSKDDFALLDLKIILSHHTETKVFSLKRLFTH